MVVAPPVSARASRWAKPRAMPIVARVAMKGGSFTRVISRPFTRPHAAPVAMPTTRLSATHSPTDGPTRPDTTGIRLRMLHAATTLENASTEPTERSMPPDTITNVIPTPMITNTAV